MKTKSCYNILNKKVVGTIELIGNLKFIKILSPYRLRTVEEQKLKN